MNAGKYGVQEPGDGLEYITPNVVISNPKRRRSLGTILFVASVVAGVAALFFQFFPEAALGTDIPMRAIAFVNSVVSLVTGWFGLVIVRPNTPTELTDTRTSEG